MPTSELNRVLRVFRHHVKLTDDVDAVNALPECRVANTTFRYSVSPRRAQS
jgi:hypothetical protein